MTLMLANCPLIKLQPLEGPHTPLRGRPATVTGPRISLLEHERYGARRESRCVSKWLHSSRCTCSEMSKTRHVDDKSHVAVLEDLQSMLLEPSEIMPRGHARETGSSRNREPESLLNLNL